jgi:hypothetical protein
MRACHRRSGLLAVDFADADIAAEYTDPSAYTSRTRYPGGVGINRSSRSSRFPDQEFRQGGRVAVRAGREVTAQHGAERSLDAVAFMDVAQAQAILSLRRRTSNSSCEQARPPTTG